MTLKDRIDQYKQQTAGKISEDVRAVMSTATEAVRASIPDRNVPTKGQSFPSFELEGTSGGSVRYEDLIANGL